MSSVPATPVESLAADDVPPGAIQYWLTHGSHKMGGFNFLCPCGCGTIGSVTFRLWSWNGNTDKPTITPSVDLQADDDTGRARSHWHGRLCDGRWEQVG